MGHGRSLLNWVVAGLMATTGVISAQQVSQTLPAVETIGEIAPIFHQLVAFQSPAKLTKFSEHRADKFYIREAVAPNETLDEWTQMITVTGGRGLAQTVGLTPLVMSQKMAAGYKKGCPDSFAARGEGAMTISGQPAYLALVGCGSVGDANGKPGSVHSETAMIVVIAGDEDYYTIQWAERGAAIKTLVLDEALWKARYQAMQPIRICPIVSGEKAPYPSCMGK